MGNPLVGTLVDTDGMEPQDLFGMDPRRRFMTPPFLPPMETPPTRTSEESNAQPLANGLRPEPAGRADASREREWTEPGARGRIGSPRIGSFQWATLHWSTSSTNWREQRIRCSCDAETRNCGEPFARLGIAPTPAEWQTELSNAHRKYQMARAKSLALQAMGHAN